MGKRIALALLAALVIAGAVLQNIYVNNAGERMRSHLAQIETALNAEDYPGAVSAADSFCTAWEAEKQTFEALFEHDEIDIISATAKSIQSFCVSYDKAHALSEIAAEKYYFNHIMEIDCVRWENIF